MTHRERLDQMWDRLHKRAAPDWLGMESGIRDVFMDLRDGKLTEHEALSAISEYVGAATGRGEACYARHT